MEKQIFLDYQLCLVLKQPIKKLRDEVLIALRLGVYQLLLMDKVPQSAAINESVKLVKKNRCAYAAGFVNACLRSVQRNGVMLPEKTAENYESVKYAMPQHLIDLWRADYGRETCSALLESLSQKPKTVIRVNTLLTDIDALATELIQAGICVEKDSRCEQALVLEKTGAIASLPAFKEGKFHVEDTAAQMAALLLEAQAGERVLDVCAAPGGKAFTIAEQMGSGKLLACDIYESRVSLIQKGAERLQIPFIQTLVQDACCFNSALGVFDRVFCDVPCSGLGIMRRKPEIRYKSIEEIEASSALQLKILTTAFGYLKQGGRLVYSTCTLHKAENEAVIEAYLKEHPAELLFQKTYFPHIEHTDGFFAAVLKKNEQ